MTPATQGRVTPPRNRVRTSPRNRVPKPPPSTAALEGLSVLDFLDLPRWNSALERGGESGFGFYFPFILAHQRPGRKTVLVTEDAGCLCVFIRTDRRRGSRLDLLLNPVPMDVGVMQRCLERANDFNRDRSARIMRIDGNDAALAARVPGLALRERRKQYLFVPHAFGELRGGKYRALRSHLQKARQLEGLEVVPWSLRHADACRDVLERWEQRHRRLTGKSGGAGISRRVLHIAATLSAPDLRGEVILLGGRPVAYSLGGRIRTGIGCFLDAKCDLEVPGLGFFQRHGFLTRLDEFELVNDGSDARQPGLRQMKNSLRPVGMHLEFRGTQVVP
jgi:hypothetical protein